MRVGAHHLLENLSQDLYSDWGASLFEIVRNGLVASMPRDVWAPKDALIEIFFEENHPLAEDGRVLVILDHGTGFTEESIDKFTSIGRSAEEKEDLPHNGEKRSREKLGVAQKRIGRFASLGLNKRSLQFDVTTGFFVLTRVDDRGPVTLVRMIPIEIEETMALPVQELDPNSPELGKLAGIKGSFSAVVIPYPVFETNEEIAEALRWRLPRKQELAFPLRIGGKKFGPPALASKVVIGQQRGGQIEVYIERVNGDTREGIWLTDADTGLRVGKASEIRASFLPYPLYREDLRGDIFIPGLLAQQNTSRSGLLPRYLASADWRKVASFLSAHVAPAVKALMGDDDTFGKNPMTKSVMSFVARCNEVYGLPEVPHGPVEPWPLGDDVEKPEDFAGETDGDNDPDKPKLGNRESRRKSKITNRKEKPRVVPFRVGDFTYILSQRANNPAIFAEVAQNGQVLYLNPSYDAAPTTREARDEHTILRMLEAIAQHKCPEDIRMMREFIGEKRRELFGKKRA
jgi:hypothetical protein